VRIERVAKRVGADQLTDPAPERLGALLEQPGHQLVQRADQHADEDEDVHEGNADVDHARVEHA
jgi:hypothetical protein